jgi:tripartite motif-containing protein 71
LAVDEYHHLIRIFSQGGDLIGSFGSYGSEPGQFNRPAGIAVGPGGKIYVADNENNRVQVFDAAGGFLWMIASDCQDCLNQPDGVAVDSNGRVFVADSANNRVLVYNRHGKFLEKIGSAGSAPGKFYFSNANDLEFDADDHLYVADSWNDRIQKFDPQGRVERIWQPAGGYDIAVDARQDVYLATQNNLIEKFGPAGDLLLSWGSEGSQPGEFDIPQAIETDAEGNVWVGDWFNRRVHKFDPQGRFLLQWAPPGAAASKFRIVDIAIDPLGRVNILDSWSQRILVLDPDGEFLTEWSLAQLTNGELGYPGGMSFDRWGNLYVTDYDNDQVFRFQLRPFNLEITGLIENPLTGEAVAFLSANASDNSDPYTYALVDGSGGEDNARFTIQGNRIQRIGAEDSSYNVRIRVTNPWGDTLEKALEVRSTGNYTYFLPMSVNMGSR